MLNRAKRFERESKEIQENKRRVEKDELIDKLQREVNFLKAELDLAYDIQFKADKNAILLEKLFENNVINEDGNLKISANFNQNEE